MFNGKLKDCLAYFFEDANFGGNLWNSYPYLVWENSKFETETSKLGGHAPSILTLIGDHVVDLPSSILEQHIFFITCKGPDPLQIQYYKYCSLAF